MKVLVHIGGAQNGLNSAGSGEVRYAMNLAEMMALNGHTVTCFGTGNHAHEAPQWGTQVPILGIRFVMLKEIVGESFDLVLNTPLEFQVGNQIWQKCKELPVNARLKVVSLFSWNKDVELGLVDNFLCGEVPRDIIVGTPYEYKSQSTDRIDMRFIPFPYFQTYAPLSIDGRNSITWACKDVFSDDWKEDKVIHSTGINVLKAIKMLADRYNLTLNYISGNTLLNSQRAERLGAKKIVESIKSKVIPNTVVPMSRIHDWMRKSRFTVILPGYAGSAFNAVADGCPAIFFEDGSDFSNILYSKERLHKDMSANQITRFLIRFMDKRFFSDFIIDQRKQVDKFSYDNAYNVLMDSIGDYL